MEQQLPVGRRLVTDELAVAMLPAAARWPARRSVMRRLMMAMIQRDSPGLWNSIACRKRYLDDRLTEALDDGIEALVLLGAGFDTRGYRLAVPRGITVFEVDLPVNLDAKRARMPVPDTVVPVPIDFETEDLGAVLAAAGYRRDARTLFVWEGVTQYLTEPAVRATLKVLSEATSGSRLAFTFVQRDFVDGVNLYDSARMYERFAGKNGIWHYGLDPGDVAPLLSGYGWREVEQVGAAEYATRYVNPAGRPGPVSDVERCVYAAKD
jgi:methyltransferase (TIGR00027 family)